MVNDKIQPNDSMQDML